MSKQVWQHFSERNQALHQQPSHRSGGHQPCSERQQRHEVKQRRTIPMKYITLVSSSILLVILTAGLHFSVSGEQVKAIGNRAYPSVDGISCDQLEGTVFHIHAHVSIYVNGQVLTVPQGIGIAPNGSCLYWLHTHTSDGIIHVEAPRQRAFSFGNFLDIWGHQFAQLGYPSQLNVRHGWQVYLNGKRFHGNFRTISLEEHTLITLAYHSPNVKPDITFNWNGL